MQLCHAGARENRASREKVLPVTKPRAVWDWRDTATKPNTPGNVLGFFHSIPAVRLEGFSECCLFVPACMNALIDCFVLFISVLSPHLGQTLIEFSANGEEGTEL